MPRNGTGTYSAPSNSFNPAAIDTTIDQDDWNTTLDDIETGITDSIARDGQTVTTASIPFASGISTNTISERSGNTGVTIDSVLLKDGRVDTAKGSDIASATTTDIGAATGNYVHVTGTVTITGLGTTTAGRFRLVQFDGALTLTHNATSLILPGGANITTAAGDVAGFVSLGSGNWKCLFYQRADGNSVIYDTDTAKTDVDQSWTGSQRSPFVTDNDGNFDMDAGQNFKCTPTGNVTIQFANEADGQSGFIRLINSGGHTISFGSEVEFAGGSAPSLGTATHLLGYICDGTNVTVTYASEVA